MFKKLYIHPGPTGAVVLN